jgi:dUTP pyrophosphatase
MSVVVKFAKVKEGAIVPSKRDEDMGFDIYACFDEDYIVIKPHETKLIPTGIASACSPEYGFLLRERGSTGSKGIALRAGVIDSGYRNEWLVGLTTTTNTDLYISKISKEDIMEKEKAKTKEIFGVLTDVFSTLTDAYWSDVIVYPCSKAIAQAIIAPVFKTTVEDIPYDELKNIKSERGMGALGSSNK